MSDPLSIAASVAGLLSLAGTASKSIFQFISSIADAPEQARHLTRELYALNVALGQVQGSLLDPRFSTENDDSSDISMLHECLASCTTVFSELENRLRNAGLTEESLGSRSVGSFQRGWKSVKWSFTDDELRELLRRVEAEKATLGLINNAFAAKLTAGILRCLKETKTQMRRMNRTLKNVQVILEWVAQKSCQQNTNHNQGSSTPMIFSPDDFLESSVVTASTSYGPGELANLLQSTSSVLSLTLETNLDDTVTVQWSPAEAAAPQRSSAAEIRLGTPQWSTDNGSNLFDSTEIIPMLQSRRFGTLDVLEKINQYEAVIDTFLSPPSFASLAWGSLKRIALVTQGNERYISDVSALQDRLQNVTRISDNLSNEGVAVQRNDMELACRDYYEYLQHFFSKKTGIRDVVKSHMSPSDEYERRKKAAFDAVTSFESFTNALFMAESIRYQKEQAAASRDQMELHRKIDMLSEKISRLETSKHEGNTGNEEAEL